MYTKAARKYAAFSIRDVDFWGCLPYSFDKRTKRIVMVNTLRRKLSWYFNIAAHLLFEAWQLFQLYRASCNPETTPTQQIYHETLCVGFMLPVAYHLGIALRVDAFFCAIHQVETFFTRVGRKYGIPLEGGRERPNGCEKLQLLFNILRVLMTCVLVLLQFLRPGRAVFLTSLLPDPWNLRYWEILPFAIIQSYLWWTFWATMLFPFMPLLAGVYAALTLLKELTISSKPAKRITKVTLRLPWNRATNFRELQLLMAVVNDACSLVLPGHKILCILLAIRAVYMMVKFPGLSRVLTAMVAGELWIYLSFEFTLLARFYEYSKETLFSWRSSRGAREGQWFRKFHRTCRPVKMEVRGFYYLDYGVVITMFSIIVDYSVNLLLTYR